MPEPLHVYRIQWHDFKLLPDHWAYEGFPADYQTGWWTAISATGRSGRVAVSGRTTDTPILRAQRRENGYRSLMDWLRGLDA